MKRIHSPQSNESNSVSIQESASVRAEWPRSPLPSARGVDRGPRYRLTWRRGPRRAQHDQTWGHLSRRASIVREAASRNPGVTIDACGVATLVVESGGERTRLWRNWQAHHYPFVCALLDELGKPNPFRFSVPASRPSSADGSKRAKPATRRNRSVRS